MCLNGIQRVIIHVKIFIFVLTVDKDSRNINKQNRENEYYGCILLI